MKKQIIFLNLIFACALAGAKTQTSIDQDRPALLYIQKYNGDRVSTVSGTNLNLTPVFQTDSLAWVNGQGGKDTYHNTEAKLTGAIYTDRNTIWPPDVYPPTLGGTMTEVVTTPKTNTTTVTAVGTPGLAFTSLGFHDSHYDGSCFETYNLATHGIIRYFTGGKNLPSRSKLHQLNMSVTPITNITWDTCIGCGGGPWRVVYYDSTKIDGMSAGAFGAIINGVSWKGFPDGKDVDVTPQVNGLTNYDFSMVATNYQPSIIANSMNLDVTNPPFCVGQNVTFQLKWKNGNGQDVTVPNVLDTLQHWTLPEKYVNQSRSGAGGCTNYYINDDLLTNNQTSCWFYNKPGGTVSMWQNLHFSNGQHASIAAMGNIDVYRPSVNPVDPHPPFAAAISSGTPPMLSLENRAMWFEVTVDSKYPGSFGLTQLVKMYSETFIPPLVPAYSSTFDDFYLDWKEYYDGPKEKSLTCQINDAPGQSLISVYGEYIGNWKVYVRFTPTGGIPVTLGRIDWAWAATALADPHWHITSDGVDGPVLHDDDNFPTWVDVRPAGN